MSNSKFIDKAKGFSSNPLGIIALFISLLYGLGTIVLSSNISNLKTDYERLPVIWFIIIFPILILITFLFLVIRHHEKLYAPKDYKDQSVFERTFMNKYEFKTNSIIATKNTTKQDVDNFINTLQAETIVNTTVNQKFTYKDYLKIIHDFFSKILDKFDLDKENNDIQSIGISMHSEEYYILDITKNIDNNSKTVSFLIKISDSNTSKDSLLTVIGKGITSNDIDDFVDKIYSYFNNKLPKGKSMNISQTTSPS